MAIQAEFGGEHPPGARIGRDSAAGGQDRDRDRQVQATAAPEQAGRAQTHRDTGHRPGQPAVQDGRADPVAQCPGVIAGHANDLETRRPGGNGGLYLDEAGRDPGQHGAMHAGNAGHGKRTGHDEQLLTVKTRRHSDSGHAANGERRGAAGTHAGGPCGGWAGQAAA